MPNKRVQQIRDALTIATQDQSNPRAKVSVGPSWREAALRVAAGSGRPVMEPAEKECRNAVGHFHFTSPLPRSYDTGQKMVPAGIMWAVVLAEE